MTRILVNYTGISGQGLYYGVLVPLMTSLNACLLLPLALARESTRKLSGVLATLLNGTSKEWSLHFLQLALLISLHFCAFET